MESETCLTCFGKGRRALTVERLILHMELGVTPTAPTCWRCSGTGRIRIPEKREEKDDV